MLTIFGPRDKRPGFCDGINRRNFLKVGALGAAGLTLPQLLRAEAAAGGRGSSKAVILVYLVGGPPHQDMFDLKPHAPVEVRGEFEPIRTSIPGIEICEHLPRMAGQMDQFAIIRSLVGAQNDHDATQCYTGRRQLNRAPAGGWPTFGAAVSQLQGPAEADMPPHVSMCYTCTHGPYNELGPGFAGVAQSSFRPLGEVKSDLILKNITYDRLADRRNLLASVDQFRREADTAGFMSGMDAFTQQAMGVLTSSRLAEALDLSKEDPRNVERYGTGNPNVHMDGNGAPRVPQSFLVARRLVEAGARIVTLNYSKWDWHGGGERSTFVRAREDLPVFDRAITALLQDLRDRGLERDHWPRVAGALLAGGGMKTGQVIGATDRVAGEAISRPVTFGEVFATLYHNLGIDVNTSTINDLSGRPQYLVEGDAQPIRELI